MISFNDKHKPLAIGAGRAVYQHPDDPNSIIKIYHDQSEPQSLRSEARQFGYLREAFVEYKHYITVLYRHGSCPPYLPEFRGFVTTSIGIGMIFEKIMDEGQASLAMTLQHALHDDNIDKKALRFLIVSFCEEFGRDRVVFRDLMPRNICVVRNKDNTVKRLVAVDGLGDFTLIPLRQKFKTAYWYWHRKVTGRLLANLDTGIIDGGIRILSKTAPSNTHRN